MISCKKISYLFLSLTLLGCLCTSVYSNVDVVNDESIDTQDNRANDVPIEEQVCTENDPTNPNCQSNGNDQTNTGQAKTDVEVKVDAEPENPDNYKDVPMLWDDDDDIADDDEIGGEGADGYYSDYYDDDFEDGDMPDFYDDELCKDNNEDCAKWADMGECDNNPQYMRANCQRSCQTCSK